MLNEMSKHPLLFIGSLLMHIILGVLLVYSFDLPDQMPVPEKIAVVKAMVVDETLIQQELDQLEALEKNKLKQEQDTKKRLDEQKRKAEEVKRERKAEERRLKETEEKQKAARKSEQERKTAEKKHQAEVQARKVLEQQRRVEEQQKKAAALEKQRAQAEAKRIADENKRKADKLRRAEEAKRQAELEAKRIEEQRRKAEQAARRAADAQRMRQQLAAEQQALATERTQKIAREVDRYILLIKQKIENKWRKPPGIADKLACEVLVKLIPGGGVAMVQIVKSSGNPVFDRSVEVAVLSAEPLPLPEDATMFEHFREILFVFDPQE
ncbi:hypothetical protein MNBD_GAMMA18-2241 [hydrothermal vent metagenome]|uniref:TolA protein n=1 Tax=hydrothermal vent metagenome TaxID=652676 RepID=A0A3B0ZIW4_9ZZZZ